MRLPLMYGSVEYTLVVIILVVAIIVFVFSIGLVFLLKPLSGRIIMESEDLYQQIEQGKAKLKSINDKLRHYVGHDFLTNVHNRRGFNEALEKEISHSSRTNSNFLIVYIDINNFKEINDRYGHTAGDELLRIYAQRLRIKIRRHDTVGRIGGDEFAIIATHVDLENKNRLVSKIKELSMIPIEFEDNEIDFTVSIGVARYPNDGKTVEELVSAADKAMYTAKREFKSE